MTLILILLLTTAGVLIRNFPFFGNLVKSERLEKPLVLQSPWPVKSSLEEELESLGVKIDGKIIEIEEDLVATFSSGTTLWLKKAEDYSPTLASLQLILKNVRIEGKWPLKIDLRFQRPVLSY